MAEKQRAIIPEGTITVEDNEDDFFDELDDDWGDEELALLKDCESQYFSAFPVPKIATDSPANSSDSTRPPIASNHTNRTIEHQTTTPPPHTPSKMIVDSKSGIPRTIATTPNESAFIPSRSQPASQRTNRNIDSLHNDDKIRLENELMEKRGEIGLVRRNLVKAEKQIEELKMQILAERKKASEDRERAYGDLQGEVERLNVQLTFMREESRILNLRQHATQNENMERVSVKQTVGNIPEKNVKIESNRYTYGQKSSQRSEFLSNGLNDDGDYISEVSHAENSPGIAHFSQNTNLTLSPHHGETDSHTQKVSSKDASNVSKLNQKHTISIPFLTVAWNNHVGERTEIDKGSISASIRDILDKELKPDTPDLDFVIEEKRKIVIDKLLALNALVEAVNESHRTSSSSSSIIVETHMVSMLEPMCELISADLKWKSFLSTNISSKRYSLLELVDSILLKGVDPNQLSVSGILTYLQVLGDVVRYYKLMTSRNRDIYVLLSLLVRSSSKVRVTLLKSEKLLRCLQSVMRWSTFCAKSMYRTGVSMSVGASGDSNLSIKLAGAQNSMVSSPFASTYTGIGTPTVKQHTIRNTGDLTPIVYPSATSTDLTRKSSTEILAPLSKNSESHVLNFESVNMLKSMFIYREHYQFGLGYIVEYLEKLAASIAKYKRLQADQPWKLVLSQLNTEMLNIALEFDTYRKNHVKTFFGTDDYAFTELYSTAHCLMREVQSSPNYLKFGYSTEFVPLSKDFKPIAGLFANFPTQRTQMTEVDVRRYPSLMLPNLRYGISKSLNSVAQFLRIASCLAYVEPLVLGQLFLASPVESDDVKTSLNDSTILSPCLALMFAPLFSYRRVLSAARNHLQSAAHRVLHLNAINSSTGPTLGINTKESLERHRSGLDVNSDIFVKTVTDVTSTLLSHPDEFGTKITPSHLSRYSGQPIQQTLSRLDAMETVYKPHNSIHNQRPFDLGPSAQKQLSEPISALVQLIVDSMISSMLPTIGAEQIRIPLEYRNISQHHQHHNVDMIPNWCICGYSVNSASRVKDSDTGKMNATTSVSNGHSSSAQQKTCICYLNAIEQNTSEFEAIQLAQVISTMLIKVLHKVSKSIENASDISTPTILSRSISKQMQEITVGNEYVIEVACANTMLPEEWRNSLSDFLISTYTHVTTAAKSPIRKSQIAGLQQRSTTPLGVVNTTEPFEERLPGMIASMFSTRRFVTAVGVLLTLECQHFAARLRNMDNGNKDSYKKDDDSATVSRVGSLADVLFTVLVTDGVAYGPETFVDAESFEELDSAIGDAVQALEEHSKGRSDGDDTWERTRALLSRFL